MVPYLRPDYPPLSLPILKGSLEKNGIETQIRDFNVDAIEYFSAEEIKLLEKYCSDASYNNKSLVKKIRLFFRNMIQKHMRSFDPDTVGISLFSFFMQRTAELFCLEIKKYKPSCKIFMGGSGVTRFLAKGNTDDWCKHVIKKKIADCVIIGEGENAVVEFCKKNVPGITIVPQIQDLERDYIPDFNGIQISKYKKISNSDYTKEGPVVTITGSRGCPRKCSFCNVESIWPTFTFRTPENIVDEMQNYVETLGIKKFKFTDSLVNGSSSHWRNLNKEIIKRNLDIEYTGQFIAKPRGQTLTQDYDLAKEAGATKLYIGIESGSENVRNHMQKKFDNNSLYQAIEMLSSRQIKQGWMLITGYPTEKQEDFEQTLELLRRYKNVSRLISVSVVSFVLIADSPIAWQDKYNDLEFVNGNRNGESLENFWICKQNPSLDINRRLERYNAVLEAVVRYGYDNDNIEKYKKRITDNSKIHDNQILS